MQYLPKLLIFFGLLLIGFSANATTDTIPSLIPQDTIFINVSDNNTFTFNHTIKKSETLFSVSQHYGLSLNDLYFFNPQIVGNIISPGQQLNIPLPKKSILRYQSKGISRDEYFALCYKVRKGDTAFNIARTRFKMPVDTLLERNSIITHNLDIGQILHVGYLKKSGIPAEHQNFKNNPELTEERLKEMAYQKGTKTVRAKVLGRIPKSVHTNDVVVVVSQQTARALGGKDNRFYVWVKK